MSDAGKDIGEALKMLFIIVMILFLVAWIWSGFDDTYPMNVTETVVYKDISHYRSHNYYNIYTNNNSFDISLAQYNKLNIGDNVTVEYNDFGSPVLIYDGCRCYSNN